MGADPLAYDVVARLLYDIGAGAFDAVAAQLTSLWYAAGAVGWRDAFSTAYGTDIDAFYAASDAELAM